MPTYFINDDGPPWVVHADVNGVLPNYTTGYTFTAYVLNPTTFAVYLGKTTGITGAPDGVISVAFTGAELSAALPALGVGQEATYPLYLKVRQTAGTIDVPTIVSTLVYKWSP